MGVPPPTVFLAAAQQQILRGTGSAPPPKPADPPLPRVFVYVFAFYGVMAAMQLLMVIAMVVQTVRGAHKVKAPVAVEKKL